MSSPFPTKEACLAVSAKALTAGIMRTMSLDPREAAEKAWRPGGPGVDEIEARIRARHARAEAHAARP